ncbi:MAG: NAD(P)/FAD-dependent oxidoreductase [Cellvibrionaceae bacterium]
MKIAIIGAGISGLTAAYVLNRQHEITVYESANRLGGHTATIDIQHQGRDYAIDTGFIVLNDWTYPNFQKILRQIGVDWQPTTMGFSVACENTGLEYSGGSLNTLFAQRRNLLNINHWRMIRDILRFNKEALVDVDSGGIYLEMTLGEYLAKKNYSSAFMDKYLIPMGSAIWSATTTVMKGFPLQFFVRFFRNHGLLSVKNRPQWHVVKGGSRAYLAPLTESFKDNIRLDSAIKNITRADNGVTVTTIHGDSDVFDQVIIASHSDQALSMLSDASKEEKNVLGAIAYQDNEVVLHTDTSLLPDRKSTWSSWNYRILKEESSNLDTLPVLTYDMNILQSIESETTFCVTLNKTDAIDPKKILGTYHYSHPVFSMDAIAAQQQWHTVNGVNNTWFCGAYWANGFHEDGVVSALRVAEQLGVTLDSKPSTIVGESNTENEVLN